VYAAKEPIALRERASIGPRTVGAATGLARSIFHQHWWIDIATDRRWGEAAFRENGVELGCLPYPMTTKYGMRISILPSLIRTLGPLVAPLPGKASTVFRRRVEITHALIDQLPRFSLFDHIFDPAITDGIAFAHRGYVLGSAYCFRINAGVAPSETWAEMTDRRRRVIRRAEAELRLAAIDDVELFCRFYEANLGKAANMHGPARMRALLDQILLHTAGAIVGAYDATGRLVAAVTLVWDTRAIYYLFGTRCPDTAENGAVSVLMWHGIQDAARRGLTFDLDGVVSPGMLQFLAGFGGQLTQRLRVRYVDRTFRFVNAVQSVVRGSPATHSSAADAGAAQGQCRPA